MPQSAIRGLSFIIAFSPTPLEVAAGNGGKGSRTLTNETKVETDGKQQKRPYITSGHVWSTNKLWPHVHQWRPKRPSVQQTHKRFVYVSFWPNGIMAMLPLPEKKMLHKRKHSLFYINKHTRLNTQNSQLSESERFHFVTLYCHFSVGFSFKLRKWSEAKLQ